MKILVMSAILKLKKVNVNYLPQILEPTQCDDERLIKQ